MKPYRLHVFVCQGKRCSAHGSEEVLERLKDRIEREGLDDEVKVSKSGCLKVCKETGVEGEYSPAVVVYPEGVWYRNVAVKDIEDLVTKHIKGGSPVERLLHFKFRG